jgi:UDP-N-acetylglucosamine--dolichyl-phosphate N-acetylglucosaminephosphotransferase
MDEHLWINLGGNFINRWAEFSLIMNSISYSLVGAVLFSFVITFVLVPVFNRFMRSIGVVGADIMKEEKKPVADMGGPGVITGFLLGVFYYIGIEIFIPPRLNGLVYILATLSTVLIITLIGVFDTLTALSKEREGVGEFEKFKKIGIPRWLYFFIPLPAAVPLMAVNAGVSNMSIPFIGRVEFGLLYPLLLVPVAVLCCSNATNFLAGFNGLEAGMGFVLHLGIGLYAYQQGQFNAAMIALCFAFALLGFLRYNWYPADVFPGDLNYTIGAVYSSVAIIGNMEKFAILCFAPYIVEAFLKAASRFEAESYGVLQADGTVKPRDKKIRGLTHLVMGIGDFTEPQVTMILIGLQAVVAAFSFILVNFI